MDTNFWMASRRLAQTLNAEQKALFMALSTSGRERDFVGEVRDQFGRPGEPADSNAGDEAALLGAVRYALGRMSTAPTMACGSVREALPGLSDGTLAAIRGAVWDAISAGQAGMDVDVETWRDLLRDVDATRDERAGDGDEDVPASSNPTGR